MQTIADENTVKFKENFFMADVIAQEYKNSTIAIQRASMPPKKRYTEI